MQDVIAAAGEQLEDVFVVEGVVDCAPIASRPNEPEHAQQAQVVGHRRLRGPKELRQVVHAQLRLREEVDDPHARRITKRLERCRHLLHNPVIRDARDYLICSLLRNSVVHSATTLHRLSA